MRNRFRSHLTFANVVSMLALSVALGGTTYAATGGNFILGQSNTAASTTALSSGTTGPALKATNTNTAAGATALGLNVPSGHTPFTVNSGAKVTNLNADKVDGLDSSQLVSNSSLRRIGPFTLTPANGLTASVQIASIPPFTFFGECTRNQGGQDGVAVYVVPSVSGAAYASLTQAAAGGSFSGASMPTQFGSYLALASPLSPGTPNVNSMSGSLLSADGTTQVDFNLYQGINARNQSGQCIFCGSFVVK
jgi:hypothetical protein